MPFKYLSDVTSVLFCLHCFIFLQFLTAWIASNHMWMLDRWPWMWMFQRIWRARRRAGASSAFSSGLEVFLRVSDPANLANRTINKFKHGRRKERCPPARRWRKRRISWPGSPAFLSRNPLQWQKINISTSIPFLFYSFRCRQETTVVTITNLTVGNMRWCKGTDSLTKYS